jgi:outer membrane lipoprotein
MRFGYFVIEKIETMLSQKYEVPIENMKTSPDHQIAKSNFRAGRIRILCVVAVALWGTGCAQSAHQSGRDLLDKILPDQLQSQIDESVSFTDLKADPSAYQGRTVMLSGIVLKSKRVKDRTEIEVLQIPTGSGAAPTKDRARSQGRFLAFKSGEFLDPAVIDAGTPVTVVGEVREGVTRSLDDGDYHYPVVEIKHVVDWDEVNPQVRAAPYAYPYGRSMYAYPYSYWGPYGGYGGYPYYGYPYYGYPYYFGPGFGFRGGSTAPSGPPPASAPPQFRKGD